MKLTITGYFDCGFSFDINDNIFDLSKIENKLKSKKYQITKNDLISDLQINLGSGIKVNLFTEDLINLWKEVAVNKAKSEFEDEVLAKTISECQIKNLTIDIFSLGIAYLRLDIENINIQKVMDNYSVLLNLKTTLH